jgi:hypothetical protein
MTDPHPLDAEAALIGKTGQELADLREYYDNTGTADDMDGIARARYVAGEADDQSPGPEDTMAPFGRHNLDHLYARVASGMARDYRPDEKVELHREPQHEPGIVLEAVGVGGGMQAAWEPVDAGWLRRDSVYRPDLPSGVNAWNEITAAAVRHAWTLYVRAGSGR